MTGDSDPSWKVKYQECLRKAEDAQRHQREREGLLCKAVSRMVLAAEGLDPELDRLFATVDEAVRDGVDIQTLRAAITRLTDTTLSHGLEGGGAAAGAELRALIKRLEVPADLHHAFHKLEKRAEQLKDPAELPPVLDQVAALWQRLCQSQGDKREDGLCALLISEVLYQLLEHLSLPAELNHRVERLRKGLESGLEWGAWNSMLAEVAEMALDIRSKIHQERMGTEQFLKQVTARLQDLDGHFRGTESVHEASLQERHALDQAVRAEFHDLHVSVQEQQDLDGLKFTVTQRLEAVTSHLEAYRQAEQQRRDQTAQRLQDLSKRLAEMEQETQQLRSRLRKERLQAMIDPLTGIPNRLAYDERVRQEVARWQRFRHPLSLILWDVDHFKAVNDTYGHQAGDNALKNIAKLMVKTIRQTDFIARYGGEEFVLLMPGASKDSALGVADKLRQQVENTSFRFRGTPVKITISCGVAEFGDGDTPPSVFARADAALYEAKENGRNRTVVK